MVRISKSTLAYMEKAAREAADRSYSPYSSFPVGAAVLTETGEVFSGCNVENAALGLSMCAERSAVFQAIAGGCREIRAVVIYTPTAKAVAPCGACRQVLSEFGPKARVLSMCDSSDRLEETLDALLPQAFDQSDIQGSPGKGE